VFAMGFSALARLVFRTGAILVLLVSGAMASELVPHRAVYTMRLASSEGQGGLAGIRGAMVYEFKDVCDAWTADAKIYLLMQYARGREIETVRKSLTWESKDGKKFRFSVEELRNKRISQQISGVAVLDGVGRGGMASYSKPRRMKVKLPAGTDFPSTHLARLIRRSAAGKPILDKVLFDGSNLDNPYEVNAVIGQYRSDRRRVPGPLAALGAASEPKKIWFARLAFFPFYSQAETSEFDMEVDYREDGIIDRMVQDFGDYSMEMLMTEIAFPPREVC
ncbi:MAG: DUF1849 family protein, partial [Rhodospirillales bacterium]|nr:DUF1849 family protein [Rhodospirillales bacterium]